MLGLIKKLFGAKDAAPAEVAPVPYKVETPAVEAAPAPVVEAQPAPVEPATPAKKPAAKKPATPKKAPAPKAAPAKSTGTRKPKAKPAA